MNSKTKKYKGRKGGIVFVDGKPLPPCNDIINHSPDGFNWGYTGSGPAQLALAMMVEEYGKNLSEHPANYHDLKFKLIAKLEQDSDFEINSQDINQALVAA